MIWLTTFQGLLSLLMNIIQDKSLMQKQIQAHKSSHKELKSSAKEEKIYYKMV